MKLNKSYFLFLWYFTLFEFIGNMTIDYIPGEQHIIPDTLSRVIKYKKDSFYSLIDTSINSNSNSKIFFHFSYINHT